MPADAQSLVMTPTSPPTIRLSEQDGDEARAAGVLSELERSEPIIVARPLYRELAKGAVKRTTEELRVKAAAAKTEKTAAKGKAGAPADPVADARREHGRALRELADRHRATKSPRLPSSFQSSRDRSRRSWLLLSPGTESLAAC
jgi:hypothetical protein